MTEIRLQRDEMIKEYLFIVDDVILIRSGYNAFIEMENMFCFGLTDVLKTFEGVPI